MGSHLSQRLLSGQAPRLGIPNHRKYDDQEYETHTKYFMVRWGLGHPTHPSTLEQEWFLPANWVLSGRLRYFQAEVRQLLVGDFKGTSYYYAASNILYDHIAAQSSWHSGVLPARFAYLSEKVYFQADWYTSWLLGWHSGRQVYSLPQRHFLLL